MKKIQNILRQQIILWICCFSFLFVNAQPAFISEDAEISILTCGIGKEAYTLFGHTALRVKDAAQQMDVVYNWGMFDFRTPNFLQKFAKGDLLYYLDVDRFDDFLYHYTDDNREVIEQKLELTYEQKTKIWQEINHQLKSEERFYTYRFVRNNCTTKVVDVLNKVLDEPLSTDFPENNHSYRFILNEGLSNHYFEKLGINLLFGYYTNKPNDLIFLPVKLKDAVAYDSAVLKSQKLLNTVSEPKQSSLNTVYTLWVIVLIVGLGCLNKKIRWAYFIVSALFSLFLLAFSLYTNHPEFYYNVAMFFFNPLFLIGLIISSRKMMIVATILSVLSLFFMSVELIVIALPLITLHLMYVLAFFLSTKN